MNLRHVSGSAAIVPTSLPGDTARASSPVTADIGNSDRWLRSDHGMRRLGNLFSGLKLDPRDAARDASETHIDFFESQRG